ncbi:quaternary amine ABC transporter ATP-binding protein [Pseudomonas putida]|uniref:quaternary amine ABC transporter ATP-binding protein n=1 Tax=Pseudomonas putida TaxID=303 RepID=UPI003F394905
MADNGFSGIKIKGLYKIFGSHPEDYIDAVKAGLSKTELLQQSAHVLGLRDINLEIPSGCIQVIMGLSGSGKSTLIRHINRLIDPTAGEVLVNGDDIVKMDEQRLREFRRQQTAMVFQKFALLPHRTVLENTVYGLDIQGISRAKSIDIAMRWLERVGLKGFEKQYPNQLSGGMQQRVGLARALANDAPVLLMDEAYSALDPLIRVDMQTVLLDLQKEIRKTIVFITHDLDEALRLGDQIAILRDGEIIQQGTSQDIVLRPQDEYIANFVREVNRGRIIQVDAVMTPFQLGHKVGDATLASGTSLEEAAHKLCQWPDADVAVTGGNGERLGVVNLRRVVEAMVSFQNSKPLQGAQGATGCNAQVATS